MLNTRVTENSLGIPLFRHSRIVTIIHFVQDCFWFHYSDRRLGDKPSELAEWIKRNITETNQPICVTESPEKFSEFMHICAAVEYAVSPLMIRPHKVNCSSPLASTFVSWSTYFDAVKIMCANCKVTDRERCYLPNLIRAQF